LAGSNLAVAAAAVVVDLADAFLKRLLDLLGGLCLASSVKPSRFSRDADLVRLSPRSVLDLFRGAVSLASTGSEFDRPSRVSGGNLVSLLFKPG
jgi:hypothetical protein